jgi:DNA-binding protein Fis
MVIVSAVDDEVTAPLARVVAGVVPSLIERLRSAQPRRVYRGAMALMERPLLHHALALTGGNQLQAARLLGLNRNTLRKRCLELGLAPSATRVGSGRRRSEEAPRSPRPGETVARDGAI